MLTIRQSLELAGQNLIDMLSPADDYMPYFWMTMDRDLKASCSSFWPSQNIVRVWDAMLRFEAATGFVMPVQIEAAMLRNLHTCVDNSLSVCGFVRPGLPEHRAALSV